MKPRDFYLLLLETQVPAAASIIYSCKKSECDLSQIHPKQKQSDASKSQISFIRSQRLIFYFFTSKLKRYFLFSCFIHEAAIIKFLTIIFVTSFVYSISLKILFIFLLLQIVFKLNTNSILLDSIN